MNRSALIVLLIAACTLAACNTVRGVGRDVSSVGKTIEKTTR
jgi:predicted small secreted protein